MVGGRSFPDSYVDSGTEAYLIDDVRLPRCPGMAWAYCAEPRIHVEAQMVGRDGSGKAVSFAVGNHRTRLERPVGAADDVAEAVPPRSTTFVWGAPFFLGRRVSLVMDGKAVPGAPSLVGPFYAFD